MWSAVHSGRNVWSAVHSGRSVWSAVHSVRSVWSAVHSGGSGWSAVHSVRSVWSAVHSGGSICSAVFKDTNILILYFSIFTMYNSHILWVLGQPGINVVTERLYQLIGRCVVIIEWE